MTDPAAKRRFVVGAAVILAIAAAFRFLRLDANSFWVDEINVLSFVRSNHFFDHLRTEGGPFEPPLHFLLVKLATQLPMGFETAARLPAAFAGVGEVGMIMLLEGTLRHRTTSMECAGLLFQVGTTDGIEDQVGIELLGGMRAQVKAIRRHLIEDRG